MPEALAKAYLEALSKKNAPYWADDPTFVKRIIIVSGNDFSSSRTILDREELEYVILFCLWVSIRVEVFKQQPPAPDSIFMTCPMVGWTSNGYTKVSQLAARLARDVGVSHVPETIVPHGGTEPPKPGQTLNW